jgi:predicted GIY-YIG superfamily endonuclease
MRGRNIRGQIKAIKTNDYTAKRVSFTDVGISKLPNINGVYKIGCGKKPLYIGSTSDLHRRINEHKRSGNDGCSISYIPTRTRKEAYNLERNLIGKSCPSRNKTKPDNCKSNWEKFFGF